MIRTLTVLITVACLTASSAVVEADDEAIENWHQWRGPLGTGSVPGGNPPYEWSEENNIKWKIPLPGIGYATPAVWGNSIFVSTAVPPDNYSPPSRGEKPTQTVKYVVLALDRNTGDVLWERLACEEIPHEGHHNTSTWATCSPVTDGRNVYAFFGSRGLYCYTVGGDLLWEKDFGDMSIRRAFGEGASPALYKDRLVVNWDHEGQSSIMVLDTSSGKELWRKNRDEVTSWMTPLIVEVSDRVQVITSATGRVRSYDLATGDVLWEGEGLTANVIPSPVEADGVVYVISGHRGSALRAIRLSEAKGNIDGTSAVLWSYNQDTPYVPSPLLHNGVLYFLKSNRGILTSIDVLSGKPHYAGQRLENIRDLYASPVGVQDRVYFLSRDGVAMVIRHGSNYEVLATNTLDDKFDASPVIVGDELFLRGHRHLYCIAQK